MDASVTSLSDYRKSVAEPEFTSLNNSGGQLSLFSCLYNPTANRASYIYPFDYSPGSAKSSATPWWRNNDDNDDS